MKLHCMAPWLGTYRGSCLSAIQEQTSCGPTPDAGWSLRLTGIWLTAQARVIWSMDCELGRTLWQVHSQAALRKCIESCLMTSPTSGPLAGTALSRWICACTQSACNIGPQHSSASLPCSIFCKLWMPFRDCWCLVVMLGRLLCWQCLTLLDLLFSACTPRLEIQSLLLLCSAAMLCRSFAHFLLSGLNLHKASGAIAHLQHDRN